MIKSCYWAGGEEIFFFLLLSFVHHPCADGFYLFAVANFLFVVVFESDAAGKGAFVTCGDSRVEVS
jgi:hypothetical protein